MRPLAAGAFVCAVLITFLTAGGRADAATVETIASLSGPNRQAILEAGARQEGVVVWSGTVGADMRDMLAKAFMRKYPYLRVEGQRLVVVRLHEGMRHGAEQWDAEPLAGQHR